MQLIHIIYMYSLLKQANKKVFICRNRITDVSLMYSVWLSVNKQTGKNIINTRINTFKLLAQINTTNIRVCL